jgi:hypothetical protein
MGREGQRQCGGIHTHELPPECGAATASPFGVIPFRNLNRSLLVERTRVVFPAMMGPDEPLQATSPNPD